MSENPGHRMNFHPVYLGAVHYVGVSKLSGNLEIGRSAALLLAVNEGLFQLGMIAEEDYVLMRDRYRRPLREVLDEAKRKRERRDTHTPVLEQEKQKKDLWVKRALVHVDYSKLTLDELHRRLDLALVNADATAMNMIKWEFKRRGIKV